MCLLRVLWLSKTFVKRVRALRIFLTSQYSLDKFNSTKSFLAWRHRQLTSYLIRFSVYCEPIHLEPTWSAAFKFLKMIPVLSRCLRLYVLESSSAFCPLLNRSFCRFGWEISFSVLLSKQILVFALFASSIFAVDKWSKPMPERQYRSESFRTIAPQPAVHGGLFREVRKHSAIFANP